MGGSLILQTFRHFTCVTTHSPTLPSLYLRHSSFSNLSDALPTSQFILQPFFRFSYVTSSSLNSQYEPPMPRAGPSLQAQEPRLQFCRRQVFHCKFRNQGSSFTRDWIGAVASCCFPHTTLSLTSEQTLKDLIRSQGHQRGGEESGFG